MTAIFGEVATVHTEAPRVGSRSGPRRSEEVEPRGSCFKQQPNWASAAVWSSSPAPSDSGHKSSAGANLGNVGNIGAKGEGKTSRKPNVCAARSRRQAATVGVLVDAYCGSRILPSLFAFVPPEGTGRTDMLRNWTLKPTLPKHAKNRENQHLNTIP